MKKAIKWTKWIDPFVNFSQLSNEDEEQSSDNSWTFSKIEFLGENYTKTNYNGNYFVSPVLGLFPLGDHNLPSKRNKFWECHTNFRITRNIIDKTKNVDGVDSFKVYSPYRFLIGIGFMFQDDEVKKNIENLLCKEEQSSFDFLEKSLSSSYSFYVTYILNNKINGFGSNSKEECENKLNTIKGAINVKKSWN